MLNSEVYNFMIQCTRACLKNHFSLNFNLIFKKGFLL